MSRIVFASILLFCLASPVSVLAETDQRLTSPAEASSIQISNTPDRAAEMSQGCDLVCGDSDGNGAISITDAVFIIAYIFGGGIAPEPVEIGDANGNGSLSITDAVFIINYIFGGGPEPVNCPASIRIIGLQPGDDTVHGTAYPGNTPSTKVVLWAKTNSWYVQPLVTEPYTYIQSDCSWTNFTHPWDRIVALLVDTSYVPGSIRDYHPAIDPGVVCWDEYPNPSLKFIDWSGYRWRIKNADLVGPGPNYFSHDTANVLIDLDDRLHLSIDFRDGNWYCAEIVLDHSLGYGVYSFKLDSRVDNLDFNTIFAGFIYETVDEEFDIEFSQRLADPYNAQYVAQPWYATGNIEFFNMPGSNQTSHSFEWRSDRIVFTSWNGHSASPAPGDIIHTWTYTGEDIPAPGGERMIFNLYLYGGESPVQGVGDEVIITSFEYVE